MFLFDRQGKTKLLLVVVLLVTVLAGGGILMFSKKPGSGEGVPTIREASKELVPLDEFIVNLADTREARYIKVEMSLEVRGNRGKEEIDELKPKVRDAVIEVLSSKYYRDLLDQSGKEALKEQIQASLNKTLQESKVVGVYFTSFAMQ